MIGIGGLLNAMRGQAQKADAGDTVSRVGVITGYDPNTYMARVTLQPDGVQTGWLQIGAKWIGNGWGMFTPPNINDQCTVVFTEGDLNGGYVSDRFWTPNDGDAPLVVQAGECWFVHKTGAFFKLLNAGGLSFSDANGATVSFDGSGNITSQGKWTHTGDMKINGAEIDTSGNINSPGTVTGQTDVKNGAGTSLTSHDHTSASPGSPTSPPIVGS